MTPSTSRQTDSHSLCVETMLLMPLLSKTVNGPTFLRMSIHSGRSTNAA